VRACSRSPRKSGSPISWRGVLANRRGFFEHKDAEAEDGNLFDTFITGNENGRAAIHAAAIDCGRFRHVAANIWMAGWAILGDRLPLPKRSRVAAVRGDDGRGTVRTTGE
jgi:hypothetical protein